MKSGFPDFSLLFNPSFLLCNRCRGYWDQFLVVPFPPQSRAPSSRFYSVSPHPSVDLKNLKSLPFFPPPFGKEEFFVFPLAFSNLFPRHLSRLFLGGCPRSLNAANSTLRFFPSSCARTPNKRRPPPPPPPFAFRCKLSQAFCLPPPPPPPHAVRKSPTSFCPHSPSLGFHAKGWKPSFLRVVGKTRLIPFSPWCVFAFSFLCDLREKI